MLVHMQKNTQGYLPIYLSTDFLGWLLIVIGFVLALFNGAQAHSNAANGFYNTEIS